MRKNEFKISKMERWFLTGERICAKGYISCVKGAVLLGLAQLVCSITLECINKQNKNRNRHGNVTRRF